MSELAGKTILVLRPSGQQESLTQKLRTLGAEVTQVPAVEIGPSPDPQWMIDALSDQRSYAWIVFTSANGVDAVSEAGLLPRGDSRVAAIGPATKRRLEELGVDVAWMPSSFTTESLAEELRGTGRVLLLRADVADRRLEQRLADRGFAPTRVDAYSISPADPAGIKAAAASNPDVTVFTSASIVASYVAAVGPKGHSGEACSIGPETSKALAAAGIPVTIAADPHTAEGIVAAIVRHFVPGGK